jgi:hypothetical protein
MLEELVTVSDAARELSRRLGETITPQRISTLFYSRKFAEGTAPIIGGRRLLRRDTLDTIQSFLVSQKGKSKRGVNND